MGTERHGNQMTPHLMAPKTRSFTWGDWTFSTSKSHILNSKCTCAAGVRPCCLCRFEQQVEKQHLPDMIFPDNFLKIQHSSGAGLQFGAVGALQQLRDTEADGVQVAHARVWKQAREDCEYSKKVVSNHDWTYTTDYTGTILGEFPVCPSTVRIDIEKLKQPEPIQFFEELYLYEDELDDNGASNCVVRVRAMESGWLVLLRHYLRVDHVMVRLKETRLYHARGSAGVVRERCTKRCSVEGDEICSSVYKSPDLIAPYLKIEEEIIDKLQLPS